jgi:hypothetical protein
MKKMLLVLCVLALTGLSLKGATKSPSVPGQASPPYHQVTLADLPAGTATWIMTADEHLDGNVTKESVDALSITIQRDLATGHYTLKGQYINTDPRNMPPLPSSHESHFDGQIFSVSEPDSGHVAFRHSKTGGTVMPLVTFSCYSRHLPESPMDYSAYSGRFENGNVNAIKGTWTDVDGRFGDFELVRVR